MAIRVVVNTQNIRHLLRQVRDNYFLSKSVPINFFDIYNDLWHDTYHDFHIGEPQIIMTGGRITTESMNVSAGLIGGQEVQLKSDNIELNSIKVADEVWIATAMLKKANPEKCCWDEEDILIQIVKNQEKFFRPSELAIRYYSIINHIRQHCVADKKPNPASLRMLSSCTEEGHNRGRNLFLNENVQRSFDEIEGKREGKTVPVLDEVPSEYRKTLEGLRDWWLELGGDPGKETPQHPPYTRARRLNQIRLRYDIYPFLANNKQHELLQRVKDFEPDDRISNGGSRYKIGFAIHEINSEGLYEAFRESLVYLPDPQEAMNRYEKLYDQYVEQLPPVAQLFVGINVEEALSEYGIEPSPPHITIDLIARQQYEIYEKAMDNNELATASAALKEIALLYGYHNDV